MFFLGLFFSGVFFLNINKADAGNCGQGNVGTCFPAMLRNGTGFCPVLYSLITGKCNDQEVCCQKSTAGVPGIAIGKPCGQGGTCEDGGAAFACPTSSAKISGTCVSQAVCCKPKPTAGATVNTAAPPAAVNPAPVTKTPSASSSGIVPSQCGPNNSGCKTDYTNALKSQCENQYGAGYCDTVKDYVDVMASDCDTNVNKAQLGFDCNLISSKGVYGNEAAKYAAFSAGGSGAGTTSPLPGGDGTTSPLPASGTAKCETGFKPEAGVCFPTSTGLSEATFSAILLKLFNWLLTIFVVLAISAFIISGIQYVTSGGSEKMIETAKRNMVWSIVGVIVGLSGMVIVKTIAALIK